MLFIDKTDNTKELVVTLHSTSNPWPETVPHPTTLGNLKPYELTYTSRIYSHFCSLSENCGSLAVFERLMQLFGHSKDLTFSEHLRVYNKVAETLGCKFAPPNE